MVNNLRRRGKNEIASTFKAFQDRFFNAIIHAPKKKSMKNIERFLDGNKQCFVFFCIFASKT